jgi:hypothetical protein
VIPDLLWRCPLCASNDALRHSQRWLRREVVNCTVCGAQWRVKRVVGDNFYLKIIHPGGNPTAYSPGFELSITAWYDLMKQTVHLKALPEPSSLLEVGEELYLASEQATLWAEAQPAFSRVDTLSPAAAEIIPPPGADLPGIEAVGGQVGQGQLFLTNQRMIWLPSSVTAEHPKPSADPQPFTFPLHQVNGIYAILNLGLAVVIGMRLYYLRFAHESPLKWVTYAALLAPQVQAESGHQILTSHY